MKKILIIFWIFLIFEISGNIWDNIFGNFKSPRIVFPKNFKSIFSFENDIITFKIYVSYSSKYKFIKSRVEVELFHSNITVNASEVYLNISNDTLFYHNPDLPCKIYKTPKLIQGAFNTTDLNNIWELLSFYDGQNQKGLLKFDISNLLQMLLKDSSSNIFAYFTKEKNLKYIEVNISGRKFFLDVLEELKEFNFISSDFDIPYNWNCEKEINNIKNLTEFGGVDISQILKELIDIDNANTNKNGKLLI